MFKIQEIHNYTINYYNNIKQVLENFRTILIKLYFFDMEFVG